MTIRGWPHLLLLCAATVAAFIAAARLVALVPWMWAPIVFILALIVALIVVAIASLYPAAQLWDRAWKRIDWRRWHAKRTWQYEQAKHRETKAYLAQADTEIVGLNRTIAERDRRIAELSRDLDEAHRQLRTLYDRQGKGS